MYELMQCGCGAYQGDPCYCADTKPTLSRLAESDRIVTALEGRPTCPRCLHGWHGRRVCRDANCCSCRYKRQVQTMADHLAFRLLLPLLMLVCLGVLIWGIVVTW